jgi:hypothetical protein
MTPRNTFLYRIFKEPFTAKRHTAPSSPQLAGFVSLFFRLSWGNAIRHSCNQ